MMNKVLLKIILVYASIYTVHGARFLGLYKIYNAMYNINNNKLNTNDLIGTLDEYGCLSSAGYSYCNYTDSCQRFNEPCIFKLI